MSNLFLMLNLYTITTALLHYPRVYLRSSTSFQVLTKAELGCVFALQQSMSVTSKLSPAWVLASNRHYASRLETLFHILQLQPHLAAEIINKDSQREATEMVRDQ